MKTKTQTYKWNVGVKLQLHELTTIEMVLIRSIIRGYASRNKIPYLGSKVLARMDLRDAVNAYRAIKRSDLKATIEKVEAQ
jgi:hypothetical protein